MARLLLVEDDARIRTSLEQALRDRGHVVGSASNGLTGLSQIINDRPDAVVLDLGLPDVDGFELVKMIRAVSSVAIVVATARDDECDMVRTLDTGADDYIVKPFSAAQLDARLRAVFRRLLPGANEPIVIGELQITIPSRAATLTGQALDLTRREFDLLAYLAANRGRVVTKRELMTEIWDMPYGGADKTVDVHLSWLRRKLGETAAAPRYLRSVRGVGVQLVKPLV